MITLFKTNYNNLEIEYVANIEDEDTLVIITYANSNKLKEDHFNLLKYRMRCNKFVFTKLFDDILEALNCSYYHLEVLSNILKKYIIENYLNNCKNDDKILFTKLKKHYENSFDIYNFSLLTHNYTIYARSSNSIVKDSNYMTKYTDDGRVFIIYLFPYYDDGIKKLFIASKFKDDEVKCTKIKLPVLECNCNFYEEAFIIISLIEKLYTYSDNPIRLYAMLVEPIIDKLRSFYDNNSFVDINN